MDGVQAAVTLDDVLESEAALKGNAQFQALMRERYGITDLALLAVDPWCAGGCCCCCVCVGWGWEGVGRGGGGRTTRCTVANPARLAWPAARPAAT